MGCVGSKNVESQTQTHNVQGGTSTGRQSFDGSNIVKVKGIEVEQLLWFDNNTMYTMVRQHYEAMGFGSSVNRCYLVAPLHLRPSHLVYKHPNIRAVVCEGDVHDVSGFDIRNESKKFHADGVTTLHFMNMTNVHRIEITTDTLLLYSKTFESHVDEHVVDFNLVNGHKGYMLKVGGHLHVSFIPLDILYREHICIKVQGRAHIKCRYVVLNHILHVELSKRGSHGTCKLGNSSFLFDNGKLIGG